MKHFRFLPVLRAASIDELVSAYGNEFFVSGQAGVDYRNAHPDRKHTFQRNTLEAARKLGLLASRPGLAKRGEYRITELGRSVLLALEQELSDTSECKT